ncbi:MAG: hypothetical protein V3W41_06485 [Planctomycetota bacterium]
MTFSTRVLFVVTVALALGFAAQSVDAQCPSYGDSSGRGAAPAAGPAPGPAPAPAPTPGGLGGATGGGSGGATPGGGGLGGGGLGGSSPGRKSAPGKPYRAGGKVKRLKNSGNLAQSPDRLMRTSVDFFAVELPKVNSQKYGAIWRDVEALAQKEFRHRHAQPDLPVLIYFSKEYEGADVDRELEFNSSLWRDEEVGIASKLFNCYRISLDDMESVRHLGEYSKGVPWILILDQNGKRQAKLSGWSMTGTKLRKKMAKAVKVRWGENLKRILSKQAKLLLKFDQLDLEMRNLDATLASAKADVKNKRTAAAKKRVANAEKSIANAKVRKTQLLRSEAAVYAFVNDERAKSTKVAKVTPAKAAAH